MTRAVLVGGPADSREIAVVDVDRRGTPPPLIVVDVDEAEECRYRARYDTAARRYRPDQHGRLAYDYLPPPAPPEPLDASDAADFAGLGPALEDAPTSR